MLKIENIEDVRTVADLMHDSEFGPEDIKYDSATKIFSLKSQTAEIDSPKEKFNLEFFNVEEYMPINLDKIKKAEATGGVFNNIKIRNNGLNLTIISQDLKIILRLSKLEGRFDKHLLKE